MKGAAGEARPLGAGGSLSAAEANRILYASAAEIYDQSEECVVDERLRSVLRDSLVEALKTVASTGSGLRILDAGGGSGNASLMLMELGYQPLTVDISPEMLAIFRRKAKERGYAPHCRVAELRDFFQDGDSGSWDMVVFSSVLHHLEDPEDVLELVRQRANPGSVVVTAFDPVRLKAGGRLLRRLDYMLHVMLRTPRRCIGLAAARLGLRASSDGANLDQQIGELAERHAVHGLDDTAIASGFTRRGWVVIAHRRRYEGRFQVTRALFRAFGQHSTFSLLVQAPAAASAVAGKGVVNDGEGR
ncbi:MAG TPA: class I SAM-dependent methyltransferase [Solirubrobacteraceae bacterium]|nr:class I SAM-dependent methyltransferase [Solirubrobacteraceae bacterium]